MKLPATLIVLGLTLLAAAVWQQADADPNQARGKALYENHCQECHESKVHIRNKSKVRSLSDLRMQVSRWAIELDQGWKTEEVEDVMSYLNEHYYHYSR